MLEFQFVPFFAIFFSEILIAFGNKIVADKSIFTFPTGGCMHCLKLCMPKKNYGFQFKENRACLLL